jgi:hypothetical protein
MNPILTTSPDIALRDNKNLYTSAFVLFSNASAATLDPNHCLWAELSLFIRGGESTSDYHHSAYFHPRYIDEIIGRMRQHSSVANSQVGYPTEWNRELSSHSGELEIFITLSDGSNFVSNVEALLAE